MSPATHPSLLWDVLVALHLYKRPHRARAVLADTLVAAQARGYPVHLFVPQVRARVRVRVRVRVRAWLPCRARGAQVPMLARRFGARRKISE